MNKKYGILAALIVVVGALSIYIFGSYGKVEGDAALKNKIIQTVESSNEIDFSKVANDFKWNTMYVFPPYSNPEDILRENKVDSIENNFDIEQLDSIIMIGFAENNKLVKYVYLPRNYVKEDFKEYIKTNKDNAKFNVLNNKEILFK